MIRMKYCKRIFFGIRTFFDEMKSSNNYSHGEDKTIASYENWTIIIIFCPVLFIHYSILFYSILFYSILFYFILSCTIHTLFYAILLYSIPFYSNSQIELESFSKWSEFKFVPRTDQNEKIKPILKQEKCSREKNDFCHSFP